MDFDLYIKFTDGTDTSIKNIVSYEYLNSINAFAYKGKGGYRMFILKEKISYFCIKSASIINDNSYKLRCRKRMLFKNKICALILVLIATLTAVFIKDITFLIFSLIIGLLLFLSKENWIE